MRFAFGQVANQAVDPQGHLRFVADIAQGIVINQRTQHGDRITALHTFDHLLGAVEFSHQRFQWFAA